MKLRIKNQPFSWIFYHPHQGLWNWNLVFAIQRVIPIKTLSEILINLVVSCDTLVLKTRIKKLTKQKVRAKTYSAGIGINYFDFGTHKEANEIIAMHNAILSKLPNRIRILAVEANPESAALAKDALKKAKIDVEFLNCALVKEVPADGQIKLFTRGNGVGDSLYKTAFSSSVMVPAKRFSDLVKDYNFDLESSINILRMNVEGAEKDIIDDLIESDMIQHFQCFLGMWDDVSKVDLNADTIFRKTLKAHSIYTVPFNGRDLKYAQRKQAILNFVKTAILN